MELMIALAILGLAAALTFSNLGPWLRLSRNGSNEAAFWRAQAQTTLLLSELSAGAIDPEQRQLTDSRLQFRALLPRLSMTPINVTLAIRTASAGNQLVVTTAPVEHQSVLITAASPLRFTRLGHETVLIEAQHGPTWLPLAALRFDATAPLTCEFDPIARTCR
jgi:type II secretory pathway pseudopilin PulG